MVGCLIFVVGPSGVGKDTLLDGCRHWLKDDSRFHFVKRDITRPLSAGGELHNEVTVEEFQIREQRGEYCLSWGAHGLYYGIPATLCDQLRTKKSVIVNGSRGKISELAAKFDRYKIINVTANEDVLRQRLVDRARESIEEINLRIERARYILPDDPHITTLSNDQDIETGVNRLLELLIRADGRVIGEGLKDSVPAPRPGAYLLSVKDNKLLLVKTDHLHLPGGGIEGNESFEEALCREVKEETGYSRVENIRKLGDVSAYHIPDSGDQNYWLKMLRLFTGDVSDQGRNLEPDHTAVWVNPFDIWDEFDELLKHVGLEHYGDLLEKSNNSKDVTGKV